MNLRRLDRLFRAIEHHPVWDRVSWGLLVPLVAVLGVYQIKLLIPTIPGKETRRVAMGHRAPGSSGPNKPDANVWIWESADSTFDFQNGPCGTTACTEPTIVIHAANTTADQTWTIPNSTAGASRTFISMEPAQTYGASKHWQEISPCSAGQVIYREGQHYVCGDAGRRERPKEWQ